MYVMCVCDVCMCIHCVYVCICVHIPFHIAMHVQSSVYGTFYEILNLVGFIYMSYSNHYIFHQVYVIDILISPLYTTPFL